MHCNLELQLSRGESLDLFKSCPRLGRMQVDLCARVCVQVRGWGGGREGGKEGDVCVCVCVCVCIRYACMCIYLSMYREKEVYTAASAVPASSMFCITAVTPLALRFDGVEQIMTSPFSLVPRSARTSSAQTPATSARA